MAQFTGKVREMAYGIHEIMPMGQKRRTWEYILRFKRRLGYRRDGVGFYKYQGSSARRGSLKKNGRQSIGKSRGGLTTKIHILASSDRTATALTLSGGGCHDCPEGEKLLLKHGERIIETDLLMDKAYGSENLRMIARDLNYNVIVPPKSNAKKPWKYDKEKYKHRNIVERLFCRIKTRYRKVFTRYDKLDVIYLAFVFLALITEYLFLREHALNTDIYLRGSFL
jgi:transposase